MNREGFYRFEFEAWAGAGCGVLVLDTNVVAGADTEGVTYDGEYVWNDRTQRFEVNLSACAPEGTRTVQGKIAPRGGLTFGVRCSFPREPEDEQVRAETDLGPVSVRIRHLRDFP